jgi:D-alanyl-D-alanine carboxypeptidase/D-alanyl-D-alanine-endopeptidase (penicillin-binding protein 4)
MHLKQVNIYSNNFYADSIFERLGGTSEFHKYLYNKFNIDKADTFFYTGSGLGENRTTCSTTLKVLNALRAYSFNENISLTNLVSVAGVDKGTLNKRFTHELNKQVLAKTGTLRHTSTLAGFLNKLHGISFAVFNHTYQLNKARSMQEDFLYKFSLLNKLFSFKYTPKEYISIKDSNIKKGTY